MRTLGSTLAIASHNQGKIREIAELLKAFPVTVKSAGELGVSEPEETGVTFAENAILKAKHTADAIGETALADDSGLVVDALDGAPGIYSARWAGPEKDFNVAMARVERELRERGVEPTGARARFISVLALAWPDGTTEVFEGKIEGTLTFPARGDHGFGYDPVFVPHGYLQTFAEIDQARKNMISHRARAFQQLQAFVTKLAA